MFESEYLRIEGISTGNFITILKNGQKVWLQKTGPDTAVSPDLKEYVLNGADWVEVTQEPADQADDAA